MKKTNRLIMLTAGVLIFAMFAAIPLALAMDVPVMTKEELQSRMEKGDVVILDVRAGRDWDSSEFKIQGAQRPDGKEVAAWADNFAKDKTTVLYCA